MGFFVFIIAIAAFLSVCVAVVFVMLVVGIHKGDRGRQLFEAPDTALDALTRSFLGVGIRHSHHKEN